MLTYLRRRARFDIRKAALEAAWFIIEDLGGPNERHWNNERQTFSQPLTGTDFASKRDAEQEARASVASEREWVVAQRVRPEPHVLPR